MLICYLSKEAKKNCQRQKNTEPSLNRLFVTPIAKRNVICQRKRIELLIKKDVKEKIFSTTFPVKPVKSVNSVSVRLVFGFIKC